MGGGRPGDSNNKLKIACDLHLEVLASEYLPTLTSFTIDKLLKAEELFLADRRGMTDGAFSPASGAVLNLVGRGVHAHTTTLFKPEGSDHGFVVIIFLYSVDFLQTN